MILDWGMIACLIWASVNSETAGPLCCSKPLVPKNDIHLDCVDKIGRLKSFCGHIVGIELASGENRHIVSVIQMIGCIDGICDDSIA